MLQLAKLEYLSEQQKKKTAASLLPLQDPFLEATLPFESVAFEAGCTLDASVDAPCSARISEEEFRQLAGILTDNAIRHAGKDGSVKVRLSPARSGAVLTVINTGPAIPPEMLPRLFDRFYSQDPSHHQDGFNFGLGLAIMRLSSYHFPWTFDSKLCFGGFYVFYMLGGCFSHESETEKKSRPVSTDRMFIAIMIMSAVSLMTFIIEAIILGYIPIFSKETHAYNYFHVTGLHYFTVSSIFTHCFTITYALEMKKRGLTTQKNRKLLIAGANLVSVVINIMCLGKLNIMLSVAFPVLTVLGQIKIADFRKLPWKKVIICVCTVAVLLVGVFVAFTKLRHYEPGYLDEIFSFRDASTPTYVQYPYMYIANNYANFNYLTMCIEQHSHGLKELFPVIALTGMKFVFPRLTAFPQYFMKIEMNTLTIRE